MLQSFEIERSEKRIYQAELVPKEVLKILINKYRNRWPLRENPRSLGKLLEVLE